ncbi:PstS family phosphate ABC transporter substrate-binding protein [Haloferula rosea]|uniref:Phosphate-binding protein n=1 Tax=Haloferula rosea TaxID=490093 RepID=A0A934VEU6_9BACT|nr:PstS family phosphate ABC transporter substrate-binding protein [Haloferula rosea]MBK1825890.1 PstS family phosphate ABC transporter substrate-binding protein [Haloferula rosea]
MNMMKMMGGLIAAAAVANAAESHLDEALTEYKSVSGISGSLSSVGSDTLNNLMTFWSEGFRKAYPNVTISIEGKGSSTAPPALMEGTSQFGPMSREMKAEEIDAFEKKFGYKPTEVKVAIDALAVFAHKDNPIEGLSLKQVDGIFSSTRKRGSEDLTEWGQLGLDAWKGRAISLYGRNSASGTYGFFQKNVLGKGDYKSTVKEQPGSSAVVQGIGGDLYALGYSGIGYKNSAVRALPLSVDGSEFFEASYDNALTGDYPLARFLLVYVNKKPSEPMPAAALEFLKFVLSKDGQAIVEKDGYYPLPAELAEATIESLSK